MPPCDRATASRRTRSRRQSKNIRPETCSAGRSRPPARPARSTSMSMARWPDAFLAETVIARWRHGFDGGQRNARRRAGIRLSHARRSAAAIVALHGAGGPRCGRHAASGDRDSGFALCGFRQRRRRADHRRQCLRASVRARRADDRGLALDAISSRSGRSSRCAASNSSVTARTCSAIPASR